MPNTDTIQHREFCGADGRLHFTVGPDRVARKQMKRPHYLTKPPAIAIDAANWDAAASLFDFVEALDVATGLVRRTSREHFDSKCGTFDRGFGRQYFLPLKEWGGEPDLAPPVSRPGPQLPLPLTGVGRRLAA